MLELADPSKHFPSDIECPIADIDAILSQYPETTAMYIAAWLFARLVSPHATPVQILTQLGRPLPAGEEANDVARRPGGSERVPVAVVPIRPGDGGRKTVPRTRAKNTVDPSRNSRESSEKEEA